MTMLALAFDTETTGLVNYKKPLLHPEQPNLVQLGAILGDPETGKIKGRIDCIIYPGIDGYDWKITPKTSKIHGIYQADAEACGVHLAVASEMLLEFIDMADLLVAHNAAFDIGVIATALARLRQHGSHADAYAYADPFASKPVYCTLKASKAASYIANTSSRGVNLTSLHEQLLGRGFEGAHSAYEDTCALWECFKIMNARAQAEYNEAA